MFTRDGYLVLMMTGWFLIKPVLNFLLQGVCCYMNIDLVIRPLLVLHINYLAIFSYKQSLLTIL